MKLRVSIKLQNQFYGHIVLSKINLNYHLFAGPVLGSALYSAGGFGLPFWVVGGSGVIIAVCLYFLIPKVKGKKPDASDAPTKSLTMKGVFMVRKCRIGFYKRCFNHCPFSICSHRQFLSLSWTLLLYSRVLVLLLVCWSLT